MTDILCWAFSLMVFVVGMAHERIDLIFAAAFFLLVSAINQLRFKTYTFQLKEREMAAKDRKEQNQATSNRESQ